MDSLGLPQLPGLECLSCDVCCRFNDPATDMAPAFSPDERERVLAAGLARGAFSGAESAVGERLWLTVDATGARCPAFDRAANGCRVYGSRPLDCRLYPLVLMYDEDGSNVLLGADLACPVVEAMANTPELRAFVERTAALIETSLLDTAFACRAAIGDFKPWMEAITVLPRFGRRVCRGDLGLRRLTLGAMREIGPGVAARPAALAEHALPAVRVWADLFDLYWAVEDERVILVAGGAGPAFLITPPLGPGPIEPALRRGVEVLRAMNPPDRPAQVQEVDDGLWPTFAALGFRTTQTFAEYVYDRQALVGLRGHAYKGKRSAVNHFLEHHEPCFRPFETADLPACQDLYRRWSADRLASNEGPVFDAQIEASAAMFTRALREADDLGLRARVLEADGRLVAVTAGYAVPGGEQFAVLIEVADRAVKGAAACCYRLFCRQAEGFPFINAMTDSGLPGLARAKDLYHPLRRPISRVVAAPAG